MYSFLSYSIRIIMNLSIKKNTKKETLDERGSILDSYIDNDDE